MIDKKDVVQELKEWDQKYFIHPTSSLSQQQAEGPRFIFTEGKGIYLTDISGKTVMDGMSSLWNVHIGHGRRELAETAKQQMEKLAFTSSFATFSNEPAIRLAGRGSPWGSSSCVFYFRRIGSE